jgi:hypothetical protein
VALITTRGGVVTVACRVLVELVVVVVGSGDHFGVFEDAREFGEFGFWWLVIVGLTDVFGLDVVGRCFVSPLPPLFGTDAVLWLEGLFWLLLGEVIAL